jgi:hypothetical protein
MAGASTNFQSGKKRCFLQYRGVRSKRDAATFLGFCLGGRGSELGLQANSHMRRVLISAGLALASVAAFGQGTIYFGSTIGTQGQPPDNTIVLPNASGTPANLATGTPASAPYVAELVVDGYLIPASITPLNSGHIPDSILTLAGLAPGSTVSFQILVWNANYAIGFAQAATEPYGIWGSSSSYSGYVLGGAGIPPASPAPIPFSAFSLGGPYPIPEPAGIFLGAMGLGTALLFSSPSCLRRRRSNAQRF